VELQRFVFPSTLEMAEVAPRTHVIWHPSEGDLDFSLYDNWLILRFAKSRAIPRRYGQSAPAVRPARLAWSWDLFTPAEQDAQPERADDDYEADGHYNSRHRTEDEVAPMTSPATNRHFLLGLARATLEALHDGPSSLEAIDHVHADAVKNSLEAALDWPRLEEATTTEESVARTGGAEPDPSPGCPR
jgi:hypothetical protein